MKTMQAFSFSAVPRAARAALQWRLMLLWVLGMLIPTAVLGITMWNMLAAQLDYSVRAADIARQMDMTVLSDLLGAHFRNTAAFNSAGVLALIATLLISPLLSGMAATAARAGAVPGFAVLASGGIAEYPRMLRMLVWSVVPLGIAAAIGGAAMDWAGDHAKTVILESDANLANWAAMAVTVLLLALAHATVDAGRAALVIERRRTSAVKAWWSGCKLLLKRPVFTFGVYLLISAAGLAIAAALTVGRINVAGANVAGFIGALLLVQLTVAVIGWMRSARLFAMVELARCERG
jgi:hypothetical protein